VVVVTGFLGSGKTTLINRVLSGGEFGRVAALVNDFGAINIDAALIASVADEVVELTNGCICCSINGDLYAAAKRTLSLEPAVDRVVVETTGLADPLPVGLTFLETDLREHMSLETVLTVVDCSSFALDLFADGAPLAQIVHGDVIVLNKTDLVEEAEIASLERRIAVVKPRARTIRARFGDVPDEVLVDPHGTRLGSILADASPEAHGDGHGFRMEALQVDQPLSAARFQLWLDRGMPAGIYRAKGFVRFDRPSGVFLFQLCGSRAAFDPCDMDVPGAELVFIGQGVDRSELSAHLRACVASPQPAAVR